MSKGSSYWGTATGKIGNTVVRVRKGVRVESAYQPNVSNPRSNGQVVQRGKFADAVGFYKRAMANFFKMAYEDRKTNETDFNAYMRHNVSRAYVYSRQMVKGGEGALPYIGKWLLTFGSLYSPEVKSSASGITVPLLAGSSEDTLAETFISWLSTGYVQEGDILTIVRVMTSADGAGSDEYTDEAIGLLPGFTYTDALPAGVGPVWKVNQYIIDTKNSSQLGQQPWYKDNTGIINFEDMGNDATNSARAAAVIITRKTAGGLLCSTSQLVWNKAGEDIMSTMASEDWLQGQRKAWSSKDVILAGAMV